jgi:Ca-activated chloride channel homolog
MNKMISLVFLSLCLLTAVSFAQNKSETVQAAQTAVSYGIVVDNSGSYRPLLGVVIDASKDIVEENKADDETFLVRFISSDKIKVVHDFTDSKQSLHDALDNLYIEGGFTALLDAVYFSAKHLAENANSEPNRRKILVLMTDGEDRKSKMKIEELLKYLKEQQIKVYAVALSDEKVSQKVLDRLTKETGGKKYLPKTRSEIPAIVKELANAIRIQ